MCTNRSTHCREQMPRGRFRTVLAVSLLAAAPLLAQNVASETRALDLHEAPPAAIDETRPEGDSAAHAAIQAADRAFNQAARQRDQPAFRDLLDPDVVFFAGELHRGRLAVLAIWQHLFDGKYDFRLDAETLDITAAASGELGWAIGTVRTSFTRPGLSTPEVTEGHYLNLWRRTEANGEGDDNGAEAAWRLAYAASLVVHPTLGTARDPRSGLMTAWPELADQIDTTIDLRWRPETTVRAASGELAYTFGRYEASFTRDAARNGATTDGEKVAGAGHFLAVWKKDAQDRWQLAAEGFTPPDIYAASTDATE